MSVMTRGDDSLMISVVINGDDSDLMIVTCGDSEGNQMMVTCDDSDDKLLVMMVLVTDGDVSWVRRLWLGVWCCGTVRGKEELPGDPGCRMVTVYVLLRGVTTLLCLFVTTVFVVLREESTRMPRNV